MGTPVDPSLRACQLLGPLLHYRGLELVCEPLRPSHVQKADLVDGFTPVESVKSIVDGMGIWQVLARRKGTGGDAPAELSWFVILTESSKEATKLKNWRDMLGQAGAHALKVAEKAGLSGAVLKEIVVIAPKLTVAKKAFRDDLDTICAEKADIRIQLFPSNKFSMIVPEHSLVPKHELATKEEADAHLRLLTGGEDVSNHIPISASDAPIIWAGIYPGQFVRIWRKSSTAGCLVPVYRIVR